MVFIYFVIILPTCERIVLSLQIIHVPLNKTARLPKQCTKPSLYPVALLPGQFQEYFKG